MRLRPVHISLWLLVVLGPLLWAPGCSRPAYIGRRLAVRFDRDSVFSRAFSGLAVQDLESGRWLVEENADKWFTPASNTKVLTLITALHFLPDSLPGLWYVARGDSLYFWGSGYPGFLDDRLPYDSVLYHFLSDNERELVFCGDNFRTTALGTGWAWDDATYRYSAERSPFPIYKNSIRIEYDASRRDIYVPVRAFRNQVRYEPDSLSLRAERQGRELVLRGRAPMARVLEVPFGYSDSLMVHLLADTLHRPVHLARGCGTVPDTAQALAVIAADTVYAVMMQQSDNLMAEQLLLMAAHARTHVMHEDSIIGYMRQFVLNTRDVRWVDGSGLSRYNKFTPREMATWIAFLLKKYSPERMARIFPQGGVKGTIKAHYPPYVFAKTGTMSGVHCLSGFMTTRRGRRVVFSFMHNNYLSSSRPYKKEMRRLLEWLWEKL